VHHTRNKGIRNEVSDGELDRTTEEDEVLIFREMDLFNESSNKILSLITFSFCSRKQHLILNFSETNNIKKKTLLFMKYGEQTLYWKLIILHNY
jgi:hypothetical protein